jgi:predicted GTPase
MGKNLFEEIQEKKSNLLSLAKKAKAFGWIDEAEEKNIIDKLNNDTLTIGVIGQMKCGKSTFLNSFVFEDDVLPAATTPMTAALSVITYGEKKSIVAEFYNRDEWEEQKLQASRSLDDVAGNTLEESKIKAAKELVERSSKLGSSLESYLGKTQNDSFDNLIEYVGADGKYISITKSVTIHYPKEYLKGVEIVDTPGFNDPIVSREERTKAFLNKADVVLLMLYAGRPFDATDRDILFKNVGQCGTGRVLIGINKYDIPYENGEGEDEIKKYVCEQLRKACEECNDNLMVDILKSTTPIPLSAEMALLSELPMSKIASNEAYQFAWNRNCHNFEISSQPQMREKSHLDDLTSAVKRVVENEKEEILFRKPINAIKSAGNKRLADAEKSIQECNVLLNTLNQPDDELEERQNNMSKANRRLTKKINALGDDIDSELRNIVRRGRNQLEDSVESACKRMDSVIDSLGTLSSIRSISPKLDREFQVLVTRTLKREVESTGDTAKNKMRASVTEFFNDAEDILMRYIPDFDSRDFVRSVEKDLNMDIEDQSVFAYSNGDGDEEDGLSSFDKFIKDNSLSGGIFFHGSTQSELHKFVNEIRGKDVAKYLDSVFKRKDEVIETVKNRFIKELVEPLEAKIGEIAANHDQWEKNIQETQEKLSSLKKEKSEIEKQIGEING